MNGINTNLYNAYNHSAVAYKNESIQPDKAVTDIPADVRPVSADSNPSISDKSAAELYSAKNTYFTLLENNGLAKRHIEPAAQNTAKVAAENGSAKREPADLAIYSQRKDIAVLTQINSVKDATSFISRMQSKIQNARYEGGSGDSAARQRIDQMERIVQQAQVKMGMLQRQEAVGSVNILL